MKNNKIHNKLIESILRLTNLINQQESIPRNFGTEIKLYPSEIHTIEAIGANKDMNITSLSKIMGVKKPSMSEILRKLEKKGMVIKNNQKENKKEIIITLTAKGQIAYVAHEKYHKDMYEKIFFRLDSLSPSILEELNIALNEVNNYIDNDMEELND
jgi:DNA-binding MarR family transcriptional regulator